MKIRYVEYKNHPEATEISKSTGIVSFFILAFGFALSLIVGGDGGWGILWGILVMAAAITIVVFISKNAKAEIEDITDDVKHSLEKMGVHFSKYLKYKNEYNQIVKRIIVDETAKRLYVFNDDDFTEVDFDRLQGCYVYDYATKQMIGLVDQCYKHDSEERVIKYVKAVAPNNETARIGFHIYHKMQGRKRITLELCSPEYGNIKNAVQFSNQVLDLTKDIIEKETGLEVIYDTKIEPPPVVKKKTVDFEDAKHEPQNATIPEHLRALKTLMDEGVITEEEFISKKQELLKRM